MTIIGWIFGILTLAILALVFIASRRPDTFRVERRAVFKANPEAVFDQINDLAKWQVWSPWAEKDPNAKGSFGPATMGEGAWFSWDGDKNVGKGTMTITQAVRPRKVAMRLAFEKPFKATNQADFELAPLNGGTEVVWAISGPAPLISKIVGMFMNMDKMIGKDFERGFEKLRTIVER